MSRSMNESCIRQAMNIIKEDLTRNQSFKRMQRDVNKQEGDIIVEIMTHPGYPCITEEAGCSVKGPDDFARSQDRLCELNFLKSNKAFELFSEMSHMINDA